MKREQVWRMKQIITKILWNNYRKPRPKKITQKGAKSLTKGKTYSFKMRSYKTTPSGNKVYSYGYGPIVSVRIK